MNSQLIRMEAAVNGYSEGIALDAAGYVSEGSGENVFVVRDGKILTPPLGSSVLPGITRDTVIQLARDLGIPVVETLIPREMLYIADEVFFTRHRGRDHADPLGRPHHRSARAGAARSRRSSRANSSRSSKARSRIRTDGSRRWRSRSARANSRCAKKRRTLVACTPPFKVESEENFRAGTGLRPPPPRLTHPPVPRRNLLSFVPRPAAD